MGASGKKLQGHGARHKGKSPPAQSKDGGYGLPPHPLAVRSGQRYAPRAGKFKRPFQVLGRPDAATGKVAARRLDGAQERFTLPVARLLATRADGQGRSVQFLGFEARRYRTFATVAALGDDGHAELVVPEWHPGRPVLQPARLLPAEARRVGAWLEVTAELGAGRPAWLEVAILGPCPDPGPEACHRATYRPVPSRAARPRPATGAGCGDIVVAVPPDGLEGRPRVGGLVEIAVEQRPAGAAPGDRVYLESGGRVGAYLTLRGRQIIPNGERLRCDPEPLALDPPIPVAADHRRRHYWAWSWRWFPREEG